MIMIPTMIDGSLLLYAFARGRERRPARSCFRPGSDWSTPLLTPFAPATWSDRSLLILTFFFPASLPHSTSALSLLSTSPFNPFALPLSLSLSRVCLFLPSYLLLFDFCSLSHAIPVRLLHPLLPSCIPFSPPVLTFKREIWRLYRTSLGRVFYALQLPRTQFEWRRTIAILDARLVGVLIHFTRDARSQPLDSAIYCFLWGIRRLTAPMGAYTVLPSEKNRSAKICLLTSVFTNTKRFVYKRFEQKA